VNNEDKKIPSHFLRLKENHPTMIKLMKLYAVADELGINISFHGVNAVLSDKDNEDVYFYVQDVDDGEAIQDFPPATEFKIIFENPEFLKFQEEEAKQDRFRREQKEKEKREKEAARRELEEKRIAKEKEMKDRALLRVLRERYPDE
jgi:hypothetical protein